MNDTRTKAEWLTLHRLWKTKLAPMGFKEAVGGVVCRFWHPDLRQEFDVSALDPTTPEKVLTLVYARGKAVGRTQLQDEIKALLA